MCQVKPGLGQSTRPENTDDGGSPTGFHLALAETRVEMALKGRSGSFTPVPRGENREHQLDRVLSR